MVDENAQVVLAVTDGIGDVKRPNGTPYQLAGIFVTIECHGGIGAYALKLQEVALVAFLLAREHLIIDGRAMQIAVAQLAVAVVVVEVVGEGDIGGDSIATYGTCLAIIKAEGTSPAIIEGDEAALAHWLRLWETHGTAAHVLTRGYGNAALLVIVHGAVEMVDYAIVLYHAALVGE